MQQMAVHCCRQATTTWRCCRAQHANELCDIIGHLGCTAAYTACTTNFPSIVNTCKSLCTNVVSAATDLKLCGLPSQSFPGAAIIHTLHGDKSIKDISKGEKVKLLCVLQHQCADNLFSLVTGPGYSEGQSCISHRQLDECSQCRWHVCGMYAG